MLKAEYVHVEPNVVITISGEDARELMVALTTHRKESEAVDKIWRVLWGAGYQT